MEQILQMYDSDSEPEDDDVAPNPNSSTILNSNQTQTTTTTTTQSNINSSTTNTLTVANRIISAPYVDTSTSELNISQYHDSGAKEILHNPKADFLFAPIQGPLKKHEKSRDVAFGPSKTTLTGHVEFDSIDQFTFDEQYHTYQSFGYALDPSRGVTSSWNEINKTYIHGKNQGGYIGDEESLQKNRTMTVFNQSNQLTKLKKSTHKKRVKANDPSNIDGYLGPWSPMIQTKEEEEEYKNELAKRKEEWDREHPDHEAKRAAKRRKLNGNTNDNSNSFSTKIDNLDEQKIKNKDVSSLRKSVDTQDRDAENEADLEELRNKKLQWYKEQESIESSIFHGNEFRDYQGRTYMYCPPERRRKSINYYYNNMNNNNNIGNKDNENKYYIPKKRIHTWIGHKKGVNSIKFSKDGHLLLSCSNDGTCKLWNVYDDKECLRTFNGHTAGVRNICLSKDGKKFLSSSFDRWVKLWDMETGKVIWRGSSGKVPYDATLYPENENEFLAGQKNKIAVQWDIRSNRIVQVYDEHLSTVNSITFIDNNRRFVTTSDDKKIFVWDYGTPVVIKHVSDPTLHSVPFMTVHPNKKWVLGQSMDNQIVVYSADSRFRLNTKKHFKGHLSAGYASQVDVSPDGRFVMSGDATGKLYFWDWRTSRSFGRLQCHHKVVMGCIWHPVLTSKVATCSWDGTIKLWD